MAVLHSSDVDCLLVMTVCRYRLHLRLRCRLSFAWSNSLHRGDGGGGGGEGGGGGGGLEGLRGLGRLGGDCPCLNTAAVSTDPPGSALRSLQSRPVRDTV